MFKSGSIMFLAQYLVGVFRQFDSEYEIKALELGFFLSLSSLVRCS